MMKLLVILLVFSGSLAQKPQMHALAPENRTELFLRWLIEGCDGSDGRRNCQSPLRGHPLSEYEGYDGWYNNLGSPSLGAIDQPLLRVLPARYDDGVYQPVKRDVNPFSASDELMQGANGKTSKIGRTAFLVFFGQQVVEEILDAQRPACPPEYFNIPIDPSHEYSSIGPEMPLLRTRFDQTTGTSPNNPRQQLNEITPYLDGGLVYGIAKGWADVLRTKKNGEVEEGGQLAHNEESEFLPERNYQRLPEANPPPPTFHQRHEQNGETENVDRFFKLGNPRGNENPFLLTFGIFWYRWHNVIAKFLRKRYNDDVTDEIVFNEARKWVIATQQSIVMYDWLPKYLGSDLEPYYDGNGKGGYDPSVNPQVSHSFQSAAMRFGHTLVTSGVYLRDTASQGCKAHGFPFRPDITSRHTGVRTCNSFFRAQELFTGGQSQNFERFLLGLSSQSTEREDNIIVDDLRGRVFGPLEFNRRDLMAINIQRGRDHGLPDYNTARRHFNLPTITSFDPASFKQATGSQVSDDVLRRFGELYSSVDEVDIWSGGLLETGDGPGPLFRAIIEDQFRRIRHGDRFWFENIENDLFTSNQRQRLAQIKIIDIIMSITNLTAQDIQPDPFRAFHAQNGRINAECLEVLNHTAPCTPPEFPKVTTCRFLTPLSDRNSEPCSPPETYDYFYGSVVSYILTFLFVGLTTLALIASVNGWSLFVQRKKFQQKGTVKIREGCFKFKERVSRFESRAVVVSFSPSGDKIMVDTIYGKNLRKIDCSQVQELNVIYCSDYKNILIRAEHHYDLFMMFDDPFNGQQFFEELPQYVAVQVTCERVSSKSELTSQVVTVRDRERDLAKLSNYVMTYVFDQDESDDLHRDFLLHKKAGKFYSIHLTRAELADFFGMEEDSVFLKQLFLIMDTDSSGFISLSEFLYVMLVFNKGSLEEKAQMYFKIYDVDNSGYLTSEDFLTIFESSFRKEAKQEDASAVIENMLASIGVQSGEAISFDQFFEVLRGNKTFVDTLGLDISNQLTRSGSAFSLYAEGSEKKSDEGEDELVNLKIAATRDVPASKLEEQWRQFSNVIKNKEKLIFLACLYTLVMFWIFGERAYYYSVEREHGGLRHIAGYGVTLTRGAASAMMFTYSTILITMCRNTLSFLRSTPVNKYFPFDEMIGMHKYIAWWALAWTVLHIVGHAINFYHISTQTASDLSCLFRDFYRSTHVLPKFHYWCFETITGITGVLLTIQVAVLYIFATFARRQVFYMFWLTHNSYPLLYVLLVLHGSGNLVQPPLFHYFFLAPCILFVLDKLVSIARNTIEISVARATHLPSQVTLLHITRPPNFSFLSGQWLRLTVPSISSQEAHPFTISSAPHETFLTLHIRSVGPFTNKLRKRFPDYNDIKNDRGFQYDKVQIDGPFGEGHQTWMDYEVVIFVGGGIGITPFASILKDIVHKSKEEISTFKCKRVIFLWVTRSQKQFEWMTDILQMVEKSDLKNIIRIHIFITQFKSKLDMRSFLIYMAERHFQKVSGRSMFTGLKALTHFSRPNFAAVFSEIKARHSSVNIIGVFTCGNQSLSNSVETGCYQENKNPGPVLKHYYENF